jgi:glycine/D-amino acid oxidase-like deaminating enzyme
MREAMSSQDAGSRMPDLHDKIAWSFLETPKYNPKTGVSRLGWVYGLQNKPAGQFWIGGEDRRPEELISADDSIISPQGRVDLETMLTQVFTEKWIPEKPKILGMWTGIVALTGDTLPFVGRLPSSLTARSGNGEWIAGGWNQYGMSNGLTCGNALARMILGKEIPEWFPKEYLITEERLRDEKFTTEASAVEYLKWTGLDAVVDAGKQPLDSHL